MTDQPSRRAAMAHAGPTLLVIADRIHATFGPGAPRPADAILIRDGIVAAIGPRAELEAAAPHAQRFDLRGTTIDRKSVV